MTVINLTLIFVVVVLLAMLVFPEASANGSSLPRASVTVTSKPFRICNTNDDISNLYCTCNEQVVSCDFSKLTMKNTKNGNISNGLQSTEHVELVVFGFQLPTNASRFCICNSPSNVHLTFSANKFLSQDIKNNFQRFDLFNLKGDTSFKGGFNLNFHGDLYISNVNYIPEIAQNEFGRGSDNPIFDVQDKECCSPIKVNQNHEKPVLFIENSTIDHVRSRGLDDEHLWRTVILKSSLFNKVDQYGINFNSFNGGSNIAILKVTFKNVSALGLLFHDTANLLMAKNEFFYYSNGVHSVGVHPYFFRSASRLNNSNIILMNNVFWNTVELDVDANHVVSWYNFFDLWDRVTFETMKRTVFEKDTFTGNPGRTVSFRYNIIAWSQLKENSLDFGRNSTAFLSDNVLGTCNCSTNMNADKMAKPELNWCYSGSVPKGNGKCSIKLDAAINQCKKSQSVDFQHLCEDKQISQPAFPGVGANLTQEVGEMRINSTFLTRIVEEFNSMFGVNRLTALKKILKPVKDDSPVVADEDDFHAVDQEDENPGITIKPVNKGKSKKPATDKKRSEQEQKTFVVPVIITLTVTAFVGILGFFIYKNKNRLLRRFSHNGLHDESYSQMS